MDDERNSQNTRISSTITGSVMQKDFFVRRQQRKSSLGVESTQEDGRATQMMTLNKKSSKAIHGGSMIIENSSAVRNTIKEESVAFNNTLLRHNLMNNNASIESRMSNNNS